MYVKKYYSPDSSESGGESAAAAAAPVEAGTGAEAQAAEAKPPGSFLDEDFPDTLEEAEKQSKPAPKPTTDDAMAKKSAAADADTTKVEETEKKAATPAAKVDAANEFEFELPKPDAAAAAAEEDSSWKGLAKEVGLGDLPEDSFEAYQKAYNEKLQAERQAAVAEVSKVDEIEQLKKHGPMAVELFKYLSTDGNTIETFLQPLKEYDEVIAMDDESIVRLEFEGRKYEKEVIDQKIETLKSEGKLKDTAYDVRKYVEGMKEKKQASILSEASTKYDQAKQTVSNQRIKEDTQIKEALSRLTHFYDGKVTQEMKDALIKKWESGEFRRRMKDDPDAVVRFMLSEEYGEAAVKTIRKMSTQEGRAGFRNKEVHNIALPGGGPKNQQAQDQVDLADAWEEGLKKPSK